MLPLFSAPIPPLSKSLDTSLCLSDILHVYTCPIHHFTTEAKHVHSYLTLFSLLQMVGLYQDPEGKQVFTMGQGGQHTTATREELSTTDTLRKRVKELEIELEKKVKYSVVFAGVHNLTSMGLVPQRFNISVQVIYYYTQHSP